jgi:hypothetical protein
MRMIFSENRLPARIKSGTGFCGIMRRQPHRYRVGRTDESPLGSHKWDQTRLYLIHN